jgi:hypothetical protein
MSDEVMVQTNYTLSEVVSIANGTIISLLNERSGHEERRFGDSDLEGFGGTGGDIGPLSSMQGLRCVLGAALALGDEPGFAPAIERISSDWPALVDEWSEVLGQFGDGFATAAPYQADNKLLAVIKRSDGAQVYTEAASWAISTAIVFLRAAQDFEFPISKEVSDRSVDLIARGLQVLAQVQLPDGGWSFSASTVDEGGSDLVFTYSVQQALADVDDYVLLRLEGADETAIAETPLVKQLNALIAQWPSIDGAKGEGASTVADVYDRLTQRSVKFMVDRYLAQATAGASGRNVGLEVQDLEIKGRIKLLNERHDLVAAYYEGYLLDGLIISRADEGRPEVTESMRQLYYRLIGRFGELSAKVQQGADEMKSPEMTTLQIELSGPQRRAQPLRYYDAGLWAQILRALILFRYYVEPLNQVEAVIVARSGSVLSLLLQDRREEDDSKAPGLWDNIGFNLPYTTRAVEAIIDSYDYLKRMETPAAQVTQATQAGAMSAPRASVLEAALVSAMTPVLDELIKKRIAEISIPAGNAIEGTAPERNKASPPPANVFLQVFQRANQEFLKQSGRDRNYGKFIQEFVASSPLSSKNFEKTKFFKTKELEVAQEMATFTYLLVSSLLPRILEEAVYNHMTPQAFGSAEKRAGDIGAAPLSLRMEDLLSALADIEAKFLTDGREAPLYADYLRNALGGSGSGRK